eukprot:scaffold182469_cov20-Tisochrysis_lutea.AAC.3
MHLVRITGRAKDKGTSNAAKPSGPPQNGIIQILQSQGLWCAHCLSPSGGIHRRPHAQLRTICCNGIERAELK